MIEEYKVNLTKYQEEFIEWVVNGVDFPLYSVFSDNITPIFNHTLRNKAIDNQSWGIANSEYVDTFDSLFKDFCKENNIMWTRILRSAINFTTHQPKDSEYDIHRDHEFRYRNFIMYLNEWTGGGTQFFDDERRLIKTIHPQKYKAIVSDNELHAQGYCDPHQRRVVLVVTFN